MHLIINGQPQEIDAVTLAEAVTRFFEMQPRLQAYGERVVATALNGDFVPAGNRATATLSSGDRIEILAPMQGG